MELANEAATNQELVANGIGIARSISKCGDKKVRPTHSGNCNG